jgi:hypothetical protein
VKQDLLLAIIQVLSRDGFFHLEKLIDSILRVVRGGKLNLN